jgi:replicative DNA helicase
VAILRHDVLKRGTRLAVVDYIQLMHMAEADGRLRRDQELGQISRGFLELAKELDITLLVLAQQNREAVKAGSNEGTGIGESFKIYQDADVFITFREKSKEEIEADGPEKGNRRMKLSKHRHGKGGVEINMIADLDVMRLREYTPNRRPTQQ